jgi:hypothetical protein
VHEHIEQLRLAHMVSEDVLVSSSLCMLGDDVHGYRAASAGSFTLSLCVECSTHEQRVVFVVVGVPRRRPYAASPSLR